MKRLTNLLLPSIREVIFGLEDGLVSTLGVITGIAEGTHDKYIILLSGLVIIFVESLSMAAGTYLSNKSEKEAHLAENKKLSLHKILHRKELENRDPIKDSVYMGISYVIGGIIPIIPYLLLPIQAALTVSVVATVTMLFLVGVGKGKLTNTNPLKSGAEMAIVSFSAAIIGFSIGRLVSNIFPQIIK